MTGLAPRRLTPREFEVARLISDGLTDPEIATRLHIGRRTAEWHVQQIFNKLGVNARAQVAAWLAREETTMAVVPGRGRQRHNLPVQLTTFVGRTELATSIGQLFRTRRLITLTGSAGAGKTRLAIEVARRNLQLFRDGAWLVDLNSITQGSLVTGAVATALGVQERPGRPLLDTLIAHLRERQILIVLDNCEHLIADCAVVIETVLGSCSSVTMLTTSREPLHVIGENVWRVPPLAVPDLTAAASAREISRFDSVKLFVDRAQLAAPGFQLTDDDAEAVGRLCSALDGLPLAIELAAAHAALISPQQMLTRLRDRFGVLTSGARTLPTHHRSLLAALAWSDSLLTDDERTLFRRMAVFFGSFSLEAAEEVCSEEGLDRSLIEDLIANLMDKSLVVTVEDPLKATRFRLLETMREYAEHGLRQSGEHDRLSRRHCDFFVSFAEQAFAGIRTAEQKAWCQRAAEELSNIRLAFYWALDHDPRDALRLAWAVNDFCVIQGMFSEGERWFELALERYRQRDDLRAKALAEGGWLAWHNEDVACATARWAECLEIYRERNDLRGVGQALQLAGNLAWQRGDLVSARDLYEQGLGLSRQAGDAFWIAGALRGLGHVDLRERDVEQARMHFEESLAWNDRIGEPRWRSYSLLPLAMCAIDRGDFAAARVYLHEHTAIAVHLNFMYGLVGTLAFFAALASAQSDPARAMRLIGAADLAEESIGIRPIRFNSDGVERWLDRSRRELSLEQAGAYIAEGRAMSTENAIAYALQSEPAFEAGITGTAEASSQKSSYGTGVVKSPESEPT